ncbi:MAG: choice-of-anchor J domain-containing protein [Bacteroidales bacterium]|nr:choice-of-anchor J domain-containing protein [Bacteroidales bacterium]
MEKIYKLINQGFIFILVASISLFFSIPLGAQTLPEHWVDDTDIDVYKESSQVQEGEYSAKVVVNSGDQSECDFENEVEIPVTAGETYKISFWANTSEHVRITSVLAWSDGNNTYPGVYVGPATNGWEEFTYEGEVPGGVDGVILRLRFYDVNGFEPGETNYVDNLTLESPVGNSLEVSNGDFEDWPGTAPEPTNYPGEFTAQANGLNVDLTWNDAQGEQPPHAYLILAGTDDNFQAPVDGEPVENDTDLSDGAAAVNIMQGAEAYAFTSLEGSTTYFFIIYPYTNTGAEINYKTDGNPPEASAETGEIVIIHEENFDDGLGSWWEYSVVGEQVWIQSEYGGETFAQITGYDGSSHENDDWLISPALDLDAFQDEVLSFVTAMNYTGPALQLKISTNYSGSGDPYNAEWETLEANWSPGSWEWTHSGSIDISSYNGSQVYLAFQYTSTDEESATWEVDNIEVMGEEIVGLTEFSDELKEVSLYPNPANEHIHIDTPVKAEVKIFNVLGNEIKSANISTGVSKLDVKTLKEGVYMIRISSEENNALKTIKLIVR